MIYCSCGHSPERKVEGGRDEIAGYAKGENGHVCTPRTEAMSSNLYNVSPYFDYTAFYTYRINPSRMERGTTSLSTSQGPSDFNILWDEDYLYLHINLQFWIMYEQLFAKCRNTRLICVNARLIDSRLVATDSPDWSF